MIIILLQKSSQMSHSSSLTPRVNVASTNAYPPPQIPETKEMIERYTAFDAKVMFSSLAPQL